ncbi:MAG: rhomboid family intramembrane serine protease [Deltaproteobacteria bacterium]|nr:rhomboid family intramembrane serine protease [Deltaproteobacteria bacterium]
MSRSGAEFVLGGTGLRIQSSRSWLPSSLIPYRDITHFASVPHGFWLGTRREIMSFRRRRFRDPDGPERLAQGLSRAIARQPHGLEQLARISQIHGLARRPAPQLVSRSLALFCTIIYLIQMRDPFIEQVGALVPALVDAGQVWRLVSANFLHGVSFIPLHLIFNVLGLLGLALLVERPLGAMRSAVVMGTSGLVAMLSSYALGQGPVMGASGIVMGLAGAALCLELQHSDRLPVWWRVPRRPFIALLLMEGVTGFTLPFVAGEAHLGGFVAGYLTTALLAGQAVMLRPTQAWVRRLGWTITALAAVALMNVAMLTLRGPDALERYARQLLATPEVGVGSDNEVAWRMATESKASRAQLGAAQELAERAADRTEYLDPEVLDTLAEVLFVRGDRDAALRVIDQAIRITRGEDYYVQQRRRFTGERASDDRPPPPLPWSLRPRDSEREDGPPGIVI